jgi:serine protease Do
VLPRVVAGAKPGSAVQLEVWRGRQSRTLDVVVGQSEPAATSAAARPASGAAPRPGRLGLTVRELPADGRRALGLSFGLVVDGVGEPNADAPLQPGDVIVAVNGERFDSLDAFNRRVAQARPGETLALLVRRGDASAFVPLKVGGG